MNACILAVSASSKHSFSKTQQEKITLLAGLGIAGDVHAGKTVKHRSRVAVDPEQINLRQVHLIHSELHAELRATGFEVLPGQMGENITTQGIDILALPKGSLLYLGDHAVIEVTGLRNPCKQLDEFQPGLLAAVLDKDKEGNLVRKAGIMAIVQVGGEVKPGDAIRCEFPPEPHQALERV